MEKIKKFTLDQLKNEFLGKPGSPQRDQYEFDLKLELLGEMIKIARKERNLTQEQLGKLIGVRKAQISKLENSLNNVTIGTILKVFEALHAKIQFKVVLEKKGKKQLA